MFVIVNDTAGLWCLKPVVVLRKEGGDAPVQYDSKVDVLNCDEEDPEMALAIKPSLALKRAQKNMRRRLNEVERLQKHSWQRLPLKAEGKRVRYKYVHADGSTVTSLRAVLKKCRNEHIACV